VVERTHSWLAAFGKLRTRFERRIDNHVGLLFSGLLRHLLENPGAVLLAAL
jgi:hypothetical protein